MDASTSQMASPLAARADVTRLGAEGATWRARERVAVAARTSLGAGITMATIAAGVAAMGSGRPAALFVVVGLGAVAAALLPERRRVVAVAVGVLSLCGLNPVFSVAFTALATTLMLLRFRAAPFFAVLIAAAIVTPKMLFSRHYHSPGLWNWINEYSLGLVIFASALWWRSRRDQRQGRGPTIATDPASFLLLFFMPAAAAYPTAFSPRTLVKYERAASEAGPDLRLCAGLLGWFVVKVIALVALRRWAPYGFLRDLTPDRLPGLGRWEAWGLVFGSYIEWYLMLATYADVPVLVARLYGWSLPNPFRAALLAWSPVELWRRWGVYNRYLLLQLVYFPLGGGRRHRTRNILLTFMASALVLHTGWFGSKYWTVGVGGWRDETIYFLLQGLAVCGWLALSRAPGDPGAAASDRALRLTPGRIAGTLATQTWSALVHVVVLAQGIDLAARARLIGRCLGL